MNITKIIGAMAAGMAVYFFSKKEKEFDAERKQHQEYVDQLLKDNEALENELNPNNGLYQSPVVFTATMNCGGHTLNQNEIILNCTNLSEGSVTIGDFRAKLWICGVESYKLIPANINSIKIPAGKTVSFRLYARNGIAIQSYVEIKRKINMLADDRDSSFMRSDTFIPAYDMPVELDIDYLWMHNAGEDEECHVLGVPGSFRWKSAVWTVGNKVGYNAASESQQKKNPSHWQQYDNN